LAARAEALVAIKILKSRSGFSLLEILIVTALMGAIALIASRAIKNGLTTKKKLDARLKVESMVFDALRLMSTDVERAFHYQHALYEIDRASLASQPNPNDPPPPGGNPSDLNPNQQALQAPPIRLTNMVGKEESLHFTTLNHYRTTANSPESNQIEVGYYLENCKSRVTREESKCLWRRSSTIIDNDVTRGGDATPLVENVTEFKLEYLSENINLKEWKRDWVTDQNGSIDTQNLFPVMVKVTLAIENKKEKVLNKFKQTVIATVRSPNNMDPSKRFASAGGQAGGGQINAGQANGGGANAGGGAPPNDDDGGGEN
jgi:prepilin-type N-terminal cleavage/methylation domain-containing protein